MLRGSFATMPPLDALEWIARRRTSGVLVAERGDVVRTFQLAAGVVTRVSSTHPAELLGRLLVGAGYLTDERLAAARGGEPLGIALVRAGLIAEDDLRAVLELKIRESVYELLSWPDGSFAFDPTAAGARREVQVAIPLRDCLEEGERRAALWRAVRERIPDDDCRFRVVQQQAGTADELLQDVARGLTVREIILERHALPFPIYQALAELSERGVIVPSTSASDRAARVASAARSLLGRRSVPRLSRPREDLAGEDLSAAERALLGRIDGRWDLMTLVRTSALGEADALLTMERLTTRGLVTL
jgi:hypothetical protein